MVVIPPTNTDPAMSQGLEDNSPTLDWLFSWRDVTKPNGLWWGNRGTASLET